MRSGLHKQQYLKVNDNSNRNTSSRYIIVVMGVSQAAVFTTHNQDAVTDVMPPVSGDKQPL